MKSKKKLLIFGAYGNLGSFFCSINKGYFDLLKAGRKFGSQFRITKLDSFEKIIIKTQPDFILNLIAATDVDECEINKFKAKYANFFIIKKIISGVKRIKKQIKFIHISTDQVYSKNKFPIQNTETDAKPINYYSKSKIMGEKIIIKNKGIVLRTNFICKSKRKFFLCDWVYKCINENKTFYGYDNIFFSPLHVSTLCKIIKTIFKKPIKNGVYNLGSNGYISKYNLIKQFIRYKKNFKGKLIKKKYVHNFSKAKRPLNMIMNSNKIEKELNLKLPKISVEVKKTILDFF